MAKLFKISLFGYSKADVGAYITQMNEDFSQKLLAKDQENRTLIQGLEEQLDRLQQENQELRAQRQEVAVALIDAKTFAAGLRTQAEEKNQAMRAENAERRQTERRRIENLSARISALQDLIRSSLHGMDAELEEHYSQCQTLADDGALAEPELEKAGGFPA